MIPSSRLGTVLALLAVSLVAAGCASTIPSKFYTLTPLKGSDASTGVIAVEEGDVLAVGPVRLPDYLDHPQILTRSEGNEIRMAETERWAGSLQEDVSRVLVENLSALIAGKRIVVVRWSSAMQTMAPFQKRLAVEVLRFEGPLGGTVILKARYALFGPDGKKVISAGESIVREPGQRVGLRVADRGDEPGLGDVQPGGRRGGPGPVDARPAPERRSVRLTGSTTHCAPRGFGTADRSNQPVGFELSGGARDGDFEDGDGR